MPQELEGDPVFAELGMPNAGMSLDGEDGEAEQVSQEETVQVETAEPEQAVEAAQEPTRTTLEELAESESESKPDETSELRAQVQRLQGMLEAMVHQSDQKVLAQQPTKAEEKEDDLEPYDLESQAIIDALADAVDDPKEYSRRVLKLIDAQAKRLAERESKRVQKELTSFKTDAQTQRATQAAEQRLQKSLDILDEHGGKTGKELVQQFRASGNQRANTYIGRFIQQNPELLLVGNENALALALQGTVNFLDKALEAKRQAVQPGVEAPGVSGNASRRSEMTNQNLGQDEDLDDEDILLDGMLDFNQIPKEDELLQALFKANPG